jgi:hypothetical protein
MQTSGSSETFGSRFWYVSLPGKTSMLQNIEGERRDRKKRKLKTPKCSSDAFLKNLDQSSWKASILALGGVAKIPLGGGVSTEAQKMFLFLL